MNNWSQSNEVCRLDSFATPQWSQSQPAFSSLAGPNAGSLAKAGFYYTGRGDNVKCWWYLDFCPSYAHNGEVFEAELLFLCSCHILYFLNAHCI